MSSNYSFYCYSHSPRGWGSEPAGACQPARGLDQEGCCLCQLNARTSGSLPIPGVPESWDSRSWEARDPSQWLTISQNSYLTSALTPILAAPPKPHFRVNLCPPAEDILLLIPQPPKHGRHRVSSSQPPDHLTFTHSFTLTAPPWPGLHPLLPRCLPLPPPQSPSLQSWPSGGVFLKHKSDPVLPLLRTIQAPQPSSRRLGVLFAASP